MRRLAFWITLAGTTIAAFVVLWQTALPLGVPGEWEWNRAVPVEPLWLAVAPLAGGAILYLAFVRFSSRRVERCGKMGLAGWLSGLVVAGFAWLWIAQESAPENYQLSKAVWVLYFRGSSGYFWEARYDPRSLREYLGGYVKKMEEGDVLHIGTHPPGLIVFFRALIAATNEFPVLTDAALATQPESVRMAFTALEESAGPTTAALTRADRAAIWLAALIAQGAAALALVPLFGLARRTNTRRASWLAAAFWPTIPALAVFLPKSDCAFPLFALSATWLWLTGLDRRSTWRLALAGLVFWLGMTLSLAFLAVGVFLFVVAVVRFADDLPSEGAGPRRSGAKPLAISSLWTAAGFALPTLAAWIAFGLNLPAVWWLNLQNHAGFYSHFSRTWWKWLLVNPIEFAFAAGVPLAVAAAWSVVRQIRSRGRAAPEHVWAGLATLGLLWLSGKNMGEAARLWIFLMPGLAWFSAALFETELARRPPGPDTAGRGISPASRPPGAGRDAAAERPSGGPTESSPSDWALILAVQLAISASTVLRVTGFHLPQ